MLNRPSDILYCNVDKDKIKNAKLLLNKENLKYFYEWFTERYKIHIKKDIGGLNPPWTTDPVMLKYRFCNVRREHDKESKWLIKNICLNNEISYENKLLNIILFRLFNKSSTFEIFGPLNFEKIDYSEIMEKIAKYRREKPEYIFFSNAFFTSGQKVAANKLFPKEKDLVLKIIMLVEKYFKEGILEKIKSSQNQLAVFNCLKGLRGIGNFLAYQIFVDFTYIPEFPFSENEFVVSGPGCVKGLKLLFEDFDGLNYEEALFWLRDNQFSILSEFGYNPQVLFNDLPEKDRKFNVMSLENCMCELSKYVRAIKGEGRPRVLYKIRF